MPPADGEGELAPAISAGRGDLSAGGQAGRWRRPHPYRATRQAEAARLSGLAVREPLPAACTHALDKRSTRNGPGDDLAARRADVHHLP
jgi:hypothetical protein